MKIKKHHLVDYNSNNNLQQSFNKQSINSSKNQFKQITYPQNFTQFILNDYTFLQDYQLIQSPINQQNIFLAKIKDTQQIVKFKKVQYITISQQKGLNMFKRFQILFKLFQKGHIIADNIFILQENSSYFYYIIQPYLMNDFNMNDNFITLQQYLLQNRKNLFTFQIKLEIFNKCKILLDNLAQFDIHYFGLNTKKILVDDQNNFFLMPFQLDLSIQNTPYKRSYYPPEILKILINQGQFDLNALHKWDIWSFGCITLQIFIFLTPYFLTYSIQNQLKKTQQIINELPKLFQKLFNQNQQIQENNSISMCNISLKVQQDNLLNPRKQKILNFCLNAFNFNQKNRILSFDHKNQKQCQNKRKIQFKQTKSTSKPLFHKNKQEEKQSNQIRKNKQAYTPCFESFKKDYFKELNKFQNFEEKGPYTLELKIISLSNITTYPKSSLKIKCKFNQNYEYQFYIDINTQENLHSILINRKITIPQKQWKYFEQLLLNNFSMIIQEQINRNNIQFSSLEINLRSLILMDNQQRVWKKPIQGNYQVKNGYFKGYKFKIKCQIRSLIEPQNNQKIKQGNTMQIGYNINKNKEQQQQKQIKQTKQNLSKFILKQKNVNQTSQSTFGSKRQSKGSKMFSQITNQIDSISSFWKTKMDNKNSSSQSFSIKKIKQNKQNNQNNVSSKLQKLLNLI